MSKPTLFLLPFASLFFASCGSKSENYDTAPTTSYDEPAATVPATAAPTYGAAVYEETSPVSPTPVDPGVAPAAPVTATAKEHTVVPGDSLWKMSKQYGVTIAAIKAANQMTNDNVILGKKMIIPAP